MTDPDTGAFIWYELMTPDPDAAKRFYDAVIGWDIAPRDPGEGGMDYRMIRRSDGGMAGGVLALSREMLDGGARPAWYGYVHVADVDAAKQAFMAAGGTVHLDRTMEGVGRMALVTDGQGAPLYVMTPTPPADNPDAKSDAFDYEKAQHFRWNDLQSDDPDGALALFGEVFGWQKTGTMPMGEMGDYTFIGRHPEDMIGAVMQRPPMTPDSIWTFYIGVDDIDRAVEAAREGGGRIDQGPDEIPGGEFSATGTDPQGVAFGIVGPRKP